MARHAQLKFVMTECSKTQIRLTGLSLFITACKTFIKCNMPDIWLIGDSIPWHPVETAIKSLVLPETYII